MIHILPPQPLKCALPWRALPEDMSKVVNNHISMCQYVKCCGFFCELLLSSCICHSMQEALFGKAPDPKAQVKKWKQQLRHEQRIVDRQIRGIQREEIKVKTSVKAAVKRGDLSNAKMLAKELVRSRKATNRLYASKATMNSVMMQMENQLAQVKMTGHMQKSAQVMAHMNKLVKVADVQETMQEMQKEMVKAGVIEEMLDDSMAVLDDEDAEDAADEEVQKVLEELNVETMAGAQKAPTKQVEQATADEDEDEEEDMASMRERLQQLRG